ncbi:retinoblastoma-binding protein 6 [Trichinella spiralis]|uniref:Uncharacterized protein n=1 Tax=Trichinella spiralis TaxID=6334 RepID=E5SGJ4_TRISP|nr:retinoblastoma-binding protein 6 [Trichinella spiralis]KRY41500.1 hypothetical protein T01_14737 [Trichinella spiralis]
MDESISQNVPLSSPAYLAFLGCNTSFCLMFNSAGGCYLQITEFSMSVLVVYNKRSVGLDKKNVGLERAGWNWHLGLFYDLETVFQRHLFEKGQDCVMALDYQAVICRTPLANVCQSFGGTLAKPAFFHAEAAPHYEVSSAGTAVCQPGVSNSVSRKFVPSTALVRLEKALVPFFLVDAPSNFNNFRVTGDVPPFNEEFSNPFREGVRRSSHLGECLLPAEEGKLLEGSKSHSTVSRGYVKDISAHTSFH